MNPALVQVLAQTPLFADISPAALDAVLACLQPKIITIPKGAFIAVENDPFTGLGILLSGKASVIKENAAGTRIVLTLLEGGDMFGEMIAFSKRSHWPVSVLAQSECLVLFLAGQKILGTCANVCDSHKRLISNLLTIVSEKALLLNRKVEYLSLRGMREKIATFLLEQHKQAQHTVFTMNFNRNDLADFLNVSRTALSRELGRMRDEGIIDFYRSSIKITNLDQLKQVVE